MGGWVGRTFSWVVGKDGENAVLDEAPSYEKGNGEEEKGSSGK